MGVDLKAKPFYLNDSEIEWVNKTRAAMSDEQKAGQLFCVLGTAFPLDELKKMIAEKAVGAVLYRPAPAEDIRSWFAQLDICADIPILKAANLEEGGSGGTTDGTFFGWPMAAGATDDAEVVRKFGRLTAAEGRMIGVNWTFSPVADIDMNYLNPITNVRSYGSNKDRVKRFTEIFAEEMQAGGIAACAKHFPGDGVDFRDHHLHPSYNSLSAEDWYDSYGSIYENLIDKGLLSIMVGHIVQPNVEMDINPELKFEDCLPASQSRELLQGVLREKYGFNGLITTDATIMGGFCMTMKRSDAILAAINAGCDMLVFNTDFEEDYGYMLSAIKDGRISDERLDEAITRILALKAKVAVNKPVTEENDEVLSHAKEWQQECADKCVTLVKNVTGLVPVQKGRYNKIRLILLGNMNVLDGNIESMAREFLESRGYAVETYDPFADDLHGTANLEKDTLSLYLANLETASNQTTVRINWCEKHALDTPRYVCEEDSVFISFANPYHLMDIPRVKAYINAYSANKAIIDAALGKVLGESEFKGVSPVDAFCGLADTRL